MKTRLTRRLKGLLWPLLVMAAVVGPGWSQAATLLVYTTGDAGAGSLRQAIDDNNAAGGGNTIIFSNTVVGTITLASELVITTNVTISGPGAKVLTISGNNSSRVFNISGGVATISGLKIADGRSSGFPGGGILNQGTLVLRDCWVADNRADNADGGGIANYAGLNLFGSTVSGNSVTFTTAGGKGGGVYNRFAAAASVVNSTVSGNTAAVGAGGIHNEGNMLLNSGTIASNSASGGSGGGGVFNSSFANVANTIIADNSSAVLGADASGPFASSGYNLIGQTNGSSGWGAPGDQTGDTSSPVDPILGPLWDNGGPTPTHALLAGSRAIDQGKTGGGATDQRGAPRPVDFPSIIDANGGDASDIGAFELGRPSLSIAWLAPDVVISWPAYYGDFTLESATTLEMSGNWSTVSNAPVVVGDQFNVTITATNGAGFFRLRAP